MNTQESSSEQLYDAQLEKLIDLALIDGTLTDKKKQILMKKAEQMGIDLDEFEMVLEAKLYSKNQENPKKHKQSNMDDEVENDEEEDDEEEDDDDDYYEKEWEKLHQDELSNQQNSQNRDSSSTNKECVYKASRISKDNTLFPPTVIFNEKGVKVILPSLLRKKEGFIPYSAITEVHVETPLIGFSSISFEGYGTRYNLTGFKKDEVNHMKRMMERREFF